MIGTGVEPTINTDGGLGHCNVRMTWKGTGHQWEGKPKQGKAISTMRYECPECGQWASLTLIWDC